MIDKICEIALAHNHNKYISAIVEHEKVYEIIMLDKGKVMVEDLLFEKMPVIDKESLEYLGEFDPFYELFQGQSKRIEIRKDETQWILRKQKKDSIFSLMIKK